MKQAPYLLAIPFSLILKVLLILLLGETCSKLFSNNFFYQLGNVGVNGLVSKTSIYNQNIDWGGNLSGYWLTENATKQRDPHPSQPGIFFSFYKPYF